LPTTHAQMHVKRLMSILSKVPLTLTLAMNLTLNPTLNINFIPHKNNHKWAFVREWLASSHCRLLRCCRLERISGPVVKLPLLYWPGTKSRSEKFCFPKLLCIHSYVDYVYFWPKRNPRGLRLHFDQCILQFTLVVCLRLFLLINIIKPHH